MALLPLADGRSSIVWSCFEAEAREIAALPDDEFGARLTAATGHVLGSLRATTPRLALPLAARHTHRYTGARFALIGDAAHQIHPLAGQGINLGLLDVGGPGRRPWRPTCSARAWPIRAMRWCFAATSGGARATIC